MFRPLFICGIKRPSYNLPSLLFQAAFVGPAGEVLAKNLKISASDKVLFATFTSDDDHSAMCRNTSIVFITLLK